MFPLVKAPLEKSGEGELEEPGTGLPMKKRTRRLQGSLPQWHPPMSSQRLVALTHPNLPKPSHSCLDLTSMGTEGHCKRAPQAKSHFGTKQPQLLSFL